MLKIKLSTKESFLNLFQRDKLNLKWFLGSLRKHRSLVFFLIYDSSTIVGGGYYFDNKTYRDYSIYIIKNYQRLGYGKKTINLLLKNKNNQLRFKISKHNKASLQFFDTVLNDVGTKFESEYYVNWLIE
ncbi:GNAT family N-acetyltransferase [Robertkochia sp. 1368]|nr:GNAT family N-acetyltransferase [Robertkochia sediminum]